MATKKSQALFNKTRKLVEDAKNAEEYGIAHIAAANLIFKQHRNPNPDFELHVAVSSTDVRTKSSVVNDVITLRSVINKRGICIPTIHVKKMLVQQLYGFTPFVLKKPKKRKAKPVDQSVVDEMMCRLRELVTPDDARAINRNVLLTQLKFKQVKEYKALLVDLMQSKGVK